MDEGNPGLLLQGIQILLGRVLRLAHVDHNLSAGGEQGLKVQFSLAAVELTQNGKVVILRGQVVCSRFVPLARNANQFVGTEGEQDDLGQGAGNGDLGDICENLHLTPQRVGEDSGGRLGGTRLRRCRLRRRGRGCGILCGFRFGGAAGSQ